MLSGTPYDTLSPLIQASLSPVLLLSAIGTTLLIIDGRLNRVVDRCRSLDILLDQPGHRAVHVEQELLSCLARAARIRWAAFCCTLSALALALVVVILFVDGQTQVKLTLLVETLFASAVLFLVIGLMLYLRDVLLVDRGLDFIRVRISDARTAREDSLRDASPAPERDPGKSRA